MPSPLDLPEILSVVASYLDTRDLARACQVSVSFRYACTPFLWRTVSLVGSRANRVWHNDTGFHQGLAQNGSFVRELRLNDTHVKDKDIELIATNCTGLKSLNLSSTNLTAETLKILLQSRPC